MKKSLLLLVLSIICLGFVAIKPSSSVVYASGETPKAEYLYDFNTCTEIYAYNENERLPIASMTKIMLLNLVYENLQEGNLSIDEEVTVSENASSMGGSQVFLECGSNYKVSDLIKSVTVASANDASVCLAERLYGSEEACVEKMNEKARDLGLNNTLFANCTGLPKPMQYSSAKDITMIFADLIKHEDYFKYSKIWMDKIEHSNNHTEISNTNKLVKFYNGCDGGKTGFTNEAGFCLTATAKRGNMRLISAVIGAKDSKSRFNAVSTMFNNGFNCYENKAVIDKNIPLDINCNVVSSKQKSLELFSEKDFFVLTKKNEKPNVDFVYDIKTIKAPVKKGDVVGSVSIYNNGVEIGKVNVVCGNDLDKQSYFDILLDTIKNW